MPVFLVKGAFWLIKTGFSQCDWGKSCVFAHENHFFIVFPKRKSRERDGKCCETDGKVEIDKNQLTKRIHKQNGTNSNTNYRLEKPLFVRQNHKTCRMHTSRRYIVVREKMCGKCVQQMWRFLFAQKSFISHRHFKHSNQIFIYFVENWMNLNEWRDFNGLINVWIETQ